MRLHARAPPHAHVTLQTPGQSKFVASVCGLSVRLFGYLGTRGASKRDAVSALKTQVEERTSRFAPNFGCLTAFFWNMS
jgi:hypothetical protein